ncbi:hypothetical protein FJT64_025963 [Amphibalanus amphitrite]|uniref:Uncharacterized protein n=1 Tax=Amphibalanus amphitrite TaxID=1232801 RepID=A0A6A4WDE0_AMPAM|nr:hypothetical protein FJT64_025963 [Amphibalanus amphitrite]
MVGEIVVTICQTPIAEMASDRGDFEALQRRVVELEARVAALELGGASGAQPAWDVPDGSPPDKLRSPDPAGSPDVLRELLGSPVPTEMWDADDWTAADTEVHPDWKLALLDNEIRKSLRDIFKEELESRDKEIKQLKEQVNEQKKSLKLKLTRLTTSSSTRVATA